MLYCWKLHVAAHLYSYNTNSCVSTQRFSWLFDVFPAIVNHTAEAMANIYLKEDGYQRKPECMGLWCLFVEPLFICVF